MKRWRRIGENRRLIYIAIYFLFCVEVIVLYVFSLNADVLLVFGSVFAEASFTVDHDSSYKKLFSEPQMVRDLLLGFVKEKWVEQLDFATLELVSAEHVGEQLQKRTGDLIWRVKFADNWLYVYLLLEFQSTVDKYMALRIMTYVGLLYEGLIRGNLILAGQKLPPVLPIVLYNGQHRWKAVQDVSELLEKAPGSLAKYCPRLKYLLLDEGTFTDLDHLKTKNLVTALFKLENSQTNGDILLVVDALVRWLAEPNQSSIARAFTVWFNNVFKAQKAERADLPDFEDLAEVKTMLSETVQGWFEEATEKGMKKGIEKGIEKGRLMVLSEMIEIRFGKLSVQHKKQLDQMSAEQLCQLSKIVLDADTIDDIFKL